MQISQADSVETLQALRIGWRQEKKGMFYSFMWSVFFFTWAEQYLFLVYLMMLLTTADHIASNDGMINA
jgi:hypothetical protein